jgi:S-formylglutathione hydrolase FrmB
VKKIGNEIVVLTRGLMQLLAASAPSTILRRMLLPVIAALILPLESACATQFQVTLPIEHAGPVSGRLIVFARPLDSANATLPQSVDAGPFEPGNGVIVAAQEVRAWAPGHTIDVDADLIAYPAAFQRARPGRYAVQMVLDRDHSYARDGRGADDLVSPVIAMDLPAGGALALAQELPPADPWTLPPSATAHTAADVKAARPFIRPFNLPSAALTGFQGRPMALKGYVVLPPGYDDSHRHYPVVYWFHGFGGPPFNLTMSAVRFQRMMARGEMPPMIWVVPDMSAPGGPTEFVDSVNNGPWGTAFTRELVSYLDQAYRTQNRPGARFLTGHSSGGWASLRLQMTYPHLFGGSWSTSPDPVDFHAFINADIYVPGANVYRGQDGRQLPLTRSGASVPAIDFAYSAQLEQVLGSYGGQNAAFEWVFSPRGEDGKPQALFDRASGAVDPQVAQYWHDHYDLSAALERLAPADRRALSGKLHLWVGSQDTFYLDRAAMRFAAAANRIGIDAKLVVVPERDHFNLYTEGTDRLALFKTMAAQMQVMATSPSPCRPSPHSSRARHRCRQPRTPVEK